VPATFRACFEAGPDAAGAPAAAVSFKVMVEMPLQGPLPGLRLPSAPPTHAPACRRDGPPGGRAAGRQRQHAPRDRAAPIRWHLATPGGGLTGRGRGAQ